MKSVQSKQARRRSGANLVEMAVVFLVFWTMLCAIFQYGWVIFIRQMAQDAVREGGRLAAAASSDSANSLYVSDTTVKQTVFNLVSMLALKNSGGTSPLAYTDIIVNHVDASTSPLTVIGGNNDGSWIGSVPTYNPASTVSDAIAIEINARYVPFFQLRYFSTSTIPIQAIAVVRTEGN